MLHGLGNGLREPPDIRLQNTRRRLRVVTAMSGSFDLIGGSKSSEARNDIGHALSEASMSLEFGRDPLYSTVTLFGEVARIIGVMSFDNRQIIC